MSHLYKTVALLPMKAHSERVKGKNFKDFCGKPLFRWVLDNLIQEKRIEKVIINTDAKSILKKHGLIDSDKVIIRERPKEICGDLVSMNKIIEDDIDNVHADTYLMTHTTNPLLSLNTINKALTLYQNGLEDGYDSLFTVNKVQNRFYDENIKPLNHNPNNLVRTQDLPPWYEENSNLYIFSKSSFKSNNARIGEKPMIMVTEPFESTDIDTPKDWELAEILVDYYQKKGIIK